MKQFSLFIILLIGIWACSKKVIPLSDNQIADANDSVSYELIVLDPQFDAWFQSHAKPANFYSQNHYEIWNKQYVNAWNSQRIGYRYSQLLDGYIDYDPFTDYGLEVNHKLFYYFVFVEQVLKIKLLPNGPKAY